MQINEGHVYGLFIAVGVAVLGSALLISSEAQDFQTTFCLVDVEGTLLTCDQIKDTLTINLDGSLEANVFSANDTLTIKLSSQTCPIGEAFTSIDSNGSLVCDVP